MQIGFRPATSQDFDYCAKLYFAGRENVGIEALADLRHRWVVAQVRMILLDGAEIGWLQSALREDAVFIVQFFIDAPFQSRGIGSEVLNQVIEEGRALEKAVTLGVVKTNPARRLYERFGFQITHKDDRKFYMRRALG